MRKTSLSVTCQVCGAPFEVRPSRLASGRGKACSRTCANVLRADVMVGNQRAVGRGPNATSFRVGLVAWNRGLKGSIPVNRTSFRQGQRAHNELAVGTQTIRVDQNGTPRRWLRIETGWVEYARWLWERDNGPLPSGLVVHHVSKSSLDDWPENLVALTRTEHIRQHRPPRPR